MKMLTNTIPTKTGSVLDSLKENIIAGVFCSNEKLPSIRTLAESFGVSTQVIISVISILEKDGWVKNNGKKGGAIVLGDKAGAETPRGLKIGIVTPFPNELGNSFHSRTYSAIMKVEALSNINGSTVHVFNKFPESFISDQTILKMKKANLDGIIYLPSFQYIQDIQMDAYRLKGLGIPIVIHQRTLPEFNCVDYDHYHMGREAASFLYSLGHRTISFLGYKKDEFHWMRERIFGFNSFFAADQISATGKVCNIPCDKGNSPPEDSVKAYLKGTKLDETALVCGNDILAIKVIKALSEMGVRVPEDISIIGFDDEMEGLRHRLTTFHLSGEAIGEMEYKLITKRISEKDTTSSAVLNVKCPLLRRHTTRSLKTGIDILAGLTMVE